jgi:hypothetical protein
MKIRIHYRDGRSGPWTTSVVEPDQIPVSGEFLAPVPVKVFRVVLALHVLFEAEYDAEVFAELVDFEQVQMEALGATVWEADQ